MPTRLRVDLAGYHHVINRGVNRSIIFNTPDDKEMFLQIINKSATIHKYKRSTHLWQDRYKSRYITDENYLYVLIRYIVQPGVCSLSLFSAKIIILF